MCPQYYILSSTTIHCRSLPLNYRTRIKKDLINPFNKEGTGKPTNPLISLYGSIGENKRVGGGSKNEHEAQRGLEKVRSLREVIITGFIFQ